MEPVTVRLQYREGSLSERHRQGLDDLLLGVVKEVVTSLNPRDSIELIMVVEAAPMKEQGLDYQITIETASRPYLRKFRQLSEHQIALAVQLYLNDHHEGERNTWPKGRISIRLSEEWVYI